MADETCRTEDLLSTKLAKIENGNDLFVWNRNDYWNGANVKEINILKAQNYDEYTDKDLNKNAATMLGYFPVTGKDSYYVSKDEKKRVATGSYSGTIDSYGNVNITPDYTTATYKTEELHYEDVTVYVKVVASGLGRGIKEKENTFLKNFNLYYDSIHSPKIAAQEKCRNYSLFGFLTALSAWGFLLFAILANWFVYFGWLNISNETITTLKIISCLFLCPFTVFFTLFTVAFYKLRKVAYGQKAIRLSPTILWLFFGFVCSAIFWLLDTGDRSGFFGTLIMMPLSFVAVLSTLGAIGLSYYVGAIMLGGLFTLKPYLTFCELIKERKVVVQKFIESGEQEKQKQLLEQILNQVV